jgi:hypothetical protein
MKKEPIHEGGMTGEEPPDSRVEHVLEKEKTFISPKEIVEKAEGRSVVVGEFHTDREGLAASLDLIRQADAYGYRILGVETSESGFEHGKRHLLGLQGEIDYIKSIGLDANLDEYDELSYMAADESGKFPRMNRYWQMQLALKLGWEIVAIDPNHWNWSQQTLEGYIYSREPQMVEKINEGGKMVAVVGQTHLGGLVEGLGEEDFVYANTRGNEKVLPPENKVYEERDLFAANLPVIREKEHPETIDSLEELGEEERWERI